MARGIDRRMPFPPSHAERRYHHDTTYQHVVDMLEHIIHEAKLTPAEVREASMLACIHYEQRNLHSFIVDARRGIVDDPRTINAIQEMETRIAALKEWIAGTPLSDR